MPRGPAGGAGGFDPPGAAPRLDMVFDPIGSVLRGFLGTLEHLYHSGCLPPGHAPLPAGPGIAAAFGPVARRPVAYVSVGRSSQDVAGGFLAVEAGVVPDVFCGSPVDPTAWPSISEAVERLAARPLFVADGTGFTWHRWSTLTVGEPAALVVDGPP